VARGDPTFAIVGVEWPHDPRYRRLKKPTYKLVCDHLWLMAHKFRKQTLDSYIDEAYMAHVCDIDTRTVRKAFARIVEEGLIEIGTDNRITICGVRKKNNRLAWKDGEISPSTGTETGFQEVGIKEKNKDKEIRTENLCKSEAQALASEWDNFSTNRPFGLPNAVRNFEDVLREGISLDQAIKTMREIPNWQALSIKDLCDQIKESNGIETPKHLSEDDKHREKLRNL